MPSVLRRLGIVSREDERGAYDVLRGEFQTAFAASEEIERLERLGSLAPGSSQQLKEEYGQRIEQIRQEIGELTVNSSHFHEQHLHEVRHHLLLVEKSRVADAFQRGLLSSAAHDRVRADIDARILELESGGGDHQDSLQSSPQQERA
jgi:hypothetical protein